MLKWSELSYSSKRLLVFISTFCATIVAFAGAWPIMEPFAAAHRGYVREHVLEQNIKIKSALEPTMSNIQISIAKSRQSQIRQQLLTIEIELAKVTDIDEKVKKQFQIKELQQEFIELGEEIKSHRFIREKSGN